MSSGDFIIAERNHMEQSRLYKQYVQDIRPALKKELGCSSVMAVPKLTSIVVNTGIGKFAKNDKAIEDVERDLTMITGQKPVRTKARKSISSFGVREGGHVGFFVTLRGQRMYHFLDRLISIALPRVRDFRGLSSKSFDGHGNYSFGLPDQEIFPEVAHEDISTVFGLQVNIATTASDDVSAKKLLRAFRFPLTEGEETGKADLAKELSLKSKADRTAAVKAKYQERDAAAAS